MSNLPTPIIMGILNLTPDSFYDGGKYQTLNSAIKKAKTMVKEGATILDLGGESTGPNSKPIPPEIELNRVIPILKAIRSDPFFDQIQISIDTYKSQIAEEALNFGANIINDVSAIRANPQILPLIKKHQAKLILMYSKDSTPHATTNPTEYTNLIQTIKTFLTSKITQAKQQGLTENQIILDTGMGAFISPNPKYSFYILKHLNQIITAFPNHQFLLGASRKSFLQLSKNLSPNQRLIPSLSAAIQAYTQGCHIFRVHDVKPTKQALATTQQIHNS